MKNKLSAFWKEYKSLVLFILLMTVFRSAIADWSPVPTGSMQPTIVEGDVILVNKLAFDLRIPLTHISLVNLSEPQRGDIIVFDSKVSDLRLVKRVIGVPGDVLEMRNNRLIINGNIMVYSNLNQPYDGTLDLTEDLLGLEHSIRLMPYTASRSSFSPIQVPSDVYFAMGDSRDNSADSRVIGFVPRNEIIGRAKRVMLSVDMDNNYLPRLDRFLHAL